MVSLGVVYAAVVLLGYDKWQTATSKTMQQDPLPLLALVGRVAMLVAVLLPQVVVLLLAAVAGRLWLR